MVFLLTSMNIPSSVAVVIATLSRISLILSELASYFAFQLIYSKHKTFRFESENSLNTPKEVLRSTDSKGKL
jgi:hypothetical protein